MASSSFFGTCLARDSISALKNSESKIGVSVVDGAGEGGGAAFSGNAPTMLAMSLMNWRMSA
eukprot:41377-Pyramimonas_sp.AAC.1